MIEKVKTRAIVTTTDVSIAAAAATAIINKFKELGENQKVLEKRIAYLEGQEQDRQKQQQQDKHRFQKALQGL
jgi:hypothetical protein